MSRLFGKKTSGETAAAEQRTVDGVPVRTYRGTSLAELAPRIREELGDSALILRQREGLTGGFAGFFAKRCVEVDVAVVGPVHGSIDTIDGPAIAPPLPEAPPAQERQSAPSEPAKPEFTPGLASAPSAQPADEAKAPDADAGGDELTETEPTSAPTASTPAAPAPAPPVIPAAPLPAPVTAEPAATASFEDHLRSAGLTDAGAAVATTPEAELTVLRPGLVHRGLPEQVAGPVVDDTLTHRLPLEPDRSAGDLLAAELARRIPTAPLAGRPGQAIAFVGTSGSGKTRAIARLAAAYGAAGRIPVACVTLQDSGSDGVLAQTLAPYGIAVHSAPDAPRALDRITALRRNALVLVDTPGVSPGDGSGLRALGGILRLLELDQVALCLPVTLSAAIARRMLRTLQPLKPTVLVATHADEADLLGGVVAVAIDRRIPLAYVSAGTGAGSIVGADAFRIASHLTASPSRSDAPEPAAAAPATGEVARAGVTSTADEVAP